MKTLLQVALVLLLVFLGFLIGAAVGGRFLAEKSGLAGSATVFFSAVGGLVIALVGGIVLARRLHPKDLRIIVFVAAVLAALAVTWIASRMASAQAADLHQPYEAAGSLMSVAQRYPAIPLKELPVGLGIARVAPMPGGSLQFFGEPGVGEIPGDNPPSDVVKFGPGQPSVEITEAPPWLVPEHLKMDYELFELRVMTLTRDWAEVIGNTRTGETRWVDRTAIQFSAWPEFLLGVSSVNVFDADANPIRARPLEASPILATSSAALPPLAVQGDWLKVSIHHLADRIQPEGWIRWRRGDRILVTYNPLS